MKRIKLKNFYIKKDVLLLVDFLSLFYRGMHVHKGLTFDGVETGGLFGIVKQLSHTIHVVRPNNIIFCSDSKPYLRTLEFPMYKEGRHLKNNEEEYLNMLEEQMLCKEFIKILKIPFVEKKGLEADDLLTMLIMKLGDDYKKIVIASNDSDLYQLLSFENVELFRGEKKGFYNQLDFKKEYSDLDPYQWNKVLSYTGGHNGLVGVSGVGLKTAIKIINKQLIRDDLIKAIKQHKKQIAINLKLGKLPYYKLKNYNIIVPSVGNYNSRGVIRFLSKYGIDITSNMDENFNFIHR